MEINPGHQSDPYQLKKILLYTICFILTFSPVTVFLLHSNIAYGMETDAGASAIFFYDLPYDQVGSIEHELVEGQIAYIAYQDNIDPVKNEYHVSAINLIDRKIIWYLNIPDHIDNLALNGSLLYVTTSTRGVWIIDVEIPEAPELIEAGGNIQTEIKRRYRTDLTTLYSFPPYNQYNQYSLGNYYNLSTLFAGSFQIPYSFGSYLPWSYQPRIPTYSWNFTQPWSTQFTQLAYQPFLPSTYYPTVNPLGQYSIGVPQYSWIPGGGYIWTQPVTGLPSSKPSSSPTTTPRYRSPVPIRLPLDNSTDTEVTGQITLRLKNLDGESVSVQEESLTIEPGEHSYTLALNKVPEKTKTEDLAKYNLKYQFVGEGSLTLTGEKSLFYLADKMEVRLIGTDSMYAGKPTAIGVHAFVHGHQVPLDGANVTIDLIKGEETYPLYTDTTDENGFIEALLNIPEELIGVGKIRAKVSSDLGSETVTEDIEIVRLYKILLTTDKPIYQPGQTIHIRTLTLKKPDLLPESGKEIIIEIEDPKGNKVFRVNPETDEFGVVSADFELGRDINLGLYTVRAIRMENEIPTESEKKVRVERYVLPKFKVDLNTDAEFYSPGDMIDGVVHARYFFGKDLSNATVTIEASKFDVEFVLFQTITGQTDAEGFFSFDLTLPSYFVGLPLEQGNAFVKLDIKVEDTAGHAEAVVRELTVTKDPIIIRLVPESGAIVPGVENKLYLMTTDPKGRGLATTNLINFDGQILDVNTDDQGLGSFNVTPEEDSSLVFQVASQANGQSALVEIDLSDPSGQPTILLRTDQAIYTVGDVMTIDVYTPEAIMARRAFVDIIRDHQTILTKGVDLNNGHSQLMVDVGNDMEGTLLVEAYYISLATETASDVFRDKKIVYVNPATDIQVAVSPDKDQYLPGEKARISFQVTPPQTAALGISIVDEAVYALQEHRPGLLKVYFSMEEDIMKPRFWPLIVPFEEAVTCDDPDEEVQEMAKIAFVTADEPDDPGLDESSFPNLLQRMKEALVSRIDKDAEKVAKDLGDQWIYSEREYEDALSEGRIKSYKDPWNNFYKLEVGNKQVILHSNGPDKKPDTPDDIFYTKQYEPVYKPYRTPASTPSTGGWWGWGGTWGFPLGGFFYSAAPTYNYSSGPAYAAYGIYESSGMADTGGTYSAQTKAGFLSPTPEGGGETPDEEPETQEPRKIRRDFPETLLWEPSLITEPDGTAIMDTNMADSITTWRMSTLASTMDGKLGGSTDGIVVFQDFFVDLDLPVALTQNDEISMPVAIYNYLEESQTVRIVLEVDQNNPWFELLDVSEKQVDLEPGQVTAVHFRIRALEVGWHELTVFGYGTMMSDAIARRIEVMPDGLEYQVSVSDRMKGNSTSHVIHIPHDAIDGASRILVKVYPGIFSQVVEGLDKLFKVPFG